MARKPRIHVAGGFYHVTLRGNHRQDIFQAPADRASMECLVAHASREVGARIHAYCWMTNHIHLLVEVGSAPLGALMQRIAGPYARDVHKRLETTGHLFERRHFARLIDTERYLLEVIRYTHFNPVRAGLAARPDDYPWSSHHAYLGRVTYPWLTTEFALSMLARTVAAAQVAYRRYMAEAEGNTLASPFEDGSTGCGDALGAASRRAASPAVDDRTAPCTLDDLIIEVCTARGVPRDHVESHSRARRLTAIRMEIARRATTSGLASLSEIARRFGRTPSALAQGLRRHK